MLPASSEEEEEEGTKDIIDNLLLSHAFTTFTTELAKTPFKCTFYSFNTWSHDPLKLTHIIKDSYQIGF